MYIVKRMTAFFVSRGVISADRQEVQIYEYGLELILADIINFAAVLLISAALQEIGSGILYLLCFVSVRIFSGGFHARTHLLCGISMILFYLLFTFICKGAASAGSAVLIAGTILAYAPLLKWAPVRNRNRPLNDSKRRKNRYRAVASYILWTLAAAAFAAFGMQSGKEILFALWIVSINIVLAQFVQFVEGSERNEEFN